MRRQWWVAGSGCALLALGVGGWLGSLNRGYPFGDARACAGSDVPLQQELDVVRLPLPDGAENVHYVTHSTAAPGDVRLAVTFRSTSHAMQAYLRKYKIVTEGLHTLDDGRFALGDVGADPSHLGLCGKAAPIQAPAVLIDKQREGLGRQEDTVDITVQLSPDIYGNIRPTTSVLLTVSESPRP
ncbi:hypothetical protein [Streptomyces montanisoli]|uniref:Uncharacterized protein n=1 Tax=Streptomyces montanisoli TaxID=2798581 RepID=A0A940RXY1_9ACTN|nr:hypothetical protein [Streptomyces montanisoli]MBP0460791.1 hypothetical protein [Streptomyces montanisoli]